jgi:2,4-dienoyl-CoA reductase-like NADH-dependent reductase (Old Yellow Enzyme family)
MNESQPEKNSRFQSLFQTGRIGKLQLGNRLIMAAMGNAQADDKGNVTGPMLAYYSARARGGVGMVITQFASISADDVIPYNLRIDNDSYIAGINRLVAAIHEQGSRACIQLMHPGMLLLLLLKSLPNDTTIKVPGITGWIGKDKPCRELAVSDIEQYIKDFADAAVRVREAGADAVEVHACHGCLLSTSSHGHK